MASGLSHIVFNDEFTVDDIDKEGRKFDRGEIASSITLGDRQRTLTQVITYLGTSRLVNFAHYNEVSRLYAKSKNYEMDLTLDYNNELYVLKAGQTFTLSLATSLSRGGAPGKDGEVEDKEQQWRPDGKGQKGIEEDFEYVMFGKVRAT